ncbi:uncharacterized protein MYCGRDRAFT_108424 [Zymoseptoria tritici IPO323]|uniref:Uncharacterized protein n=1 Tax=Zymoseptoria tritici (strain CBS 115943 / IPO323) TaxID=336722 RepID=F9X614_ZYMTI|nr:uncharacterized protein MYCGRDRAFT_108424 [Zymoseptoria tritici IPO323]EGP88631.1 hypothetical protein MYCGRDRAFT_108424 [Zymoseptoria tritici IPO323]
MNKFLKKRNGEPAPLNTYSNDAALASLTSLSSLSPGLKKSSTSRWKKSKKPQPEAPAAPVTLPMLLPSDDFRTSLLMPNLSARFSMLREQDDPKSKIGKASDDSVLQPKRRSRLNDFGWASTGLSDIAEVSSLRNGSPIIPPFARRSREMSYASDDGGYASEAEATNTSVMSRSRPGEGNVLFGGRQKIYKIAGKGGATSRGRLVYDDDVGKSAFQQYRARERDFDESQSSRPSDDSQGFDFGLQSSETGDQDDSPFGTNDSAKDFSHSLSFSGFDKKRSTTSSTARSDARSSTAATSVTSQGPHSAAPSPMHAPASMVSPPIATSSDRSTTKGRRLYDQGLDQHMHEQQSSAMSRLNTIQQQRSLSGSKTSPVLHSTRSAGNLHERAPHPVYALQAPLPAGRTSPGIPRLNTLGSTRRGKMSPAPASGPQSPLDEEVDALSQALEPADRGKATAMGAFNKPAHAFDERQYLERQQQLQRSNSSAVIKSKAAQMAESAAQRQIDRAEQNPTPASTSPEPQSLSRVDSPAQQKEPSKAYNVFQNAASQMASTGGPPAPPKAPLPDTHKTFFGNISASEDEDEEESSKIAQSFNSLDYGYGPGAGRWQPTALRPVSEHPALRNQGSKSSLAEEDEEAEVKKFDPTAFLRPDPTKPSMTSPKVPDSPTIPGVQQNLGGMMRHLRQRSNQSSVYHPEDGQQSDDDRPDVPEFPPHLSNMVDMQQSVRESQYSASNPWDLDEARSFVAPEKSTTSLVGNSSTESGAPREPSQTRAGADRELSGVSSSQDDWQKELRKQHNREASTATQQERDAFENELAARRNAIQENIKSMVERNEGSRGTSPSAGPLRGALGILKSKSSRDSMNVPSSSRSTRHLGTSDRKASNASGHSPANESPPQMPTAQHPAFKKGGTDSDGEICYERKMSSSRPRPSISSRDRSLSSATTNGGRSQSRAGNIRDDLERGRAKGLALSTTGSPSLNHSPAMTSTEFEHNPFDRDSSAQQQQQRSFDPKAALAYQQNYAQNNPRLTNSGPSSPLLTSNPSFPSIRPSVTSQPGSYNAYAANSPPQSAHSTQQSAHSTQPSYNPNILTNSRSGGLLRKKTISKSDISEPTLISSTSNIDTVELPVRASQDQASAPPIPPINPRRRGTTKKFFGRTRSGADDSEDGNGGRSGARSPIDHVSPGIGWGGSMAQMTEQERDESMDSSRSGSPFMFPASNVVRLPNADGAKKTSVGAERRDVKPEGSGAEGVMF